MHAMFALAFASVIAGALVPLRVPRLARITIIVPLVALYGHHLYEHVAELPLAVMAALALVGATLAGRVLPHGPCCAAGARPGHGNPVGLFAVAALGVHAFFDAELLRAASAWHLALLVLMHKATDGIVLAAVLRDHSVAIRWTVVIAAALATPTGYLLAEWVGDELVHELVSAFALGFYARAAFSLVRVPAESHAHAV